MPSLFAGVDDPDGAWPRYLTLADGRLLRWHYQASTGMVSGFAVTIDVWRGIGAISVADGLALLAADGVGPDGTRLSSEPA